MTDRKTPCLQTSIYLLSFKSLDLKQLTEVLSRRAVAESFNAGQLSVKKITLE